MKKLLSLALCFLLCVSMTLCAFAAPAAVENTTGGQTLLETRVPDSHKITITYNDGGHVLIGGERIPSGTQLTVPRFDPLRLDIITNPNVYIEKVIVNGEDVTDDMLYGQLTFTDVHTDMQIVFGFKDGNDADADSTKIGMQSAMSGHIYKEKELFPAAKMDIDFGAIQATADEKGAYRVDEIGEGLHKVTISDADGNVQGEDIFSITVDETLAEPKVERLANGTQLVRLPKDTKEFKLDFIVHDDGSIEIRPSVETPGEPETQPTPTEPETQKPSKPTISQTGGSMYNTPQFHATVFGIALVGFFLLLLLPLKRRKEQEEQDQ